MTSFKILLVFMITSSSVSEVLARGFIFEGLKKWILSGVGNKFKVYLEYLLTCPMCIGFWVGYFLALFMNIRIIPCAFVDGVLAGFISAASSMVLDRIIYREEQSKEKKDD
jgi:mannose/fructose/N-acetylgalactosamine-specific phosphotransferase system component IIC